VLMNDDIRSSEEDIILSDLPNLSKSFIKSATTVLVLAGSKGIDTSPSPSSSRRWGVKAVLLLIASVCSTPTKASSSSSCCCSISLPAPSTPKWKNSGSRRNMVVVVVVVVVVPLVVKVKWQEWRWS